MARGQGADNTGLAVAGMMPMNPAGLAVGAIAGTVVAGVTYPMLALKQGAANLLASAKHPPAMKIRFDGKSNTVTIRNMLGDGNKTDVSGKCENLLSAPGAESSDANQTEGSHQ